MCGIFCSVNSVLSHHELVNLSNRVAHRGPESSITECVYPHIYFGFHRLGIIAPDETQANQPLKLDDCILICNGEIYNAHELHDRFQQPCRSGSDCESIIVAYRATNDIFKTVNLLNGEFAFILLDQITDQMYIVRDRHGVRPLYWGSRSNTEYYFASELAGIPDRCAEVYQYSMSSLITGLPTNNISSTSPNQWSEVYQFPPAHIMTMELLNTGYPDFSISLKPYYTPICSRLFKLMYIKDIDSEIHNDLRSLLTDAVKIRLRSDRPIGCLLSGGLDSSLITALASHEIPNLTTFSIGLDGSRDVAYAQKVVDYLNLKNHHPITFTIEEGLAVLRNVIFYTSTYDRTTIRASIPQYLLARYISQKTDVKVLLSGEGADELFAGYQYSKNAPTAYALRNDTLRLLNELHFFDNLRTDRTISSWGLEVRVPFLDKNLVSYVLEELPDEYIMCSSTVIEKKILRNAFTKFLPSEILMRPKDAFSDAVSSSTQTWYMALIDHANAQISDMDFENASTKFPHNTPKTKEAYLYRSIFEDYYPNRASLVPHEWMPRWVEGVGDPSATVLKCCKIAN